ncbi:hypothetical protein NHQ30_003631 [Ciborinia camelliae]|nr:hypothetical protein NHQ30_003631 [Ciborinia camelliae]
MSFRKSLFHEIVISFTDSDVVEVDPKNTETWPDIVSDTMRGHQRRLKTVFPGKTTMSEWHYQENLTRLKNSSKRQLAEYRKTGTLPGHSSNTIDSENTDEGFGDDESTSSKSDRRSIPNQRSLSGPSPLIQPPMGQFSPEVHHRPRPEQPNFTISPNQNDDVFNPQVPASTQALAPTETPRPAQAPTQASAVA